MLLLLLLLSLLGPRAPAMDPSRDLNARDLDTRPGRLRPDDLLAKRLDSGKRPARRRHDDPTRGRRRRRRWWWSLRCGALLARGRTRRLGADVRRRPRRRRADDFGLDVHTHKTALLFLRYREMWWV